MNRVLLLLGLIGTCCVAAQAAKAQNHEMRIRLFAFAEFPLMIESDSVSYPEALAEYKLLTRWNQNPYHRYQSPAYFDLIAVVENRGTVPVELVELELTRDRKIGEFYDWERPPTVDPSETAEWEGSIRIETKTISTLDGKTATFVRFGPFSADQLWWDVEEQNLWPWEIKYDVTIQCNGCASDTDSASFTMSHTS